MSELSQEAISRLLHVGRLESVLTRFRANIVKLQPCPIFSQVDNQDLKDLYKNLQSLLPSNLIPPPEVLPKNPSEQASGSGQ